MYLICHVTSQITSLRGNLNLRCHHTYKLGHHRHFGIVLFNLSGDRMFKELCEFMGGIR